MKEVSILVLIKSDCASELSGKLFKMYIILSYVIPKELISSIRPALLRFFESFRGDSGSQQDSRNDFFFFA